MAQVHGQFACVQVALLLPGLCGPRGSDLEPHWSLTLALLAAAQGWSAAVDLGSDFVVYVVYKTLRRDVLSWVPGFTVPLSLLHRLTIKAFTDSTACINFRDPVDFGGLYHW
jgi:hypothetical protein